MNLTIDAMTGRFVRLEPFTAALRDEVGAGQDADAEGWAIMSSSGEGEHFAAWWDAAFGEHGRGERIGFAVRRLADGRVVGTSSYLHIRPEHGGVEIGATFFHPDARSGPVNPEAKLLMLAHAFGAGAERVEFMVDTRNLRSQAAVAKLGAVREGVLRRHKRTWTGFLRDTAVFSILREEWPAVRAGLEHRLRSLSHGERGGSRIGGA